MDIPGVRLRENGAICPLGVLFSMVLEQIFAQFEANPFVAVPLRFPCFTVITGISVGFLGPWNPELTFCRFQAEAD